MKVIRFSVKGMRKEQKKQELRKYTREKERNLDFYLPVKNPVYFLCSTDLIVLGFNNTSTLEGHFVSSLREREKRDRRESRGDEREGQGRKRNRNESEETE